MGKINYKKILEILILLFLIASMDLDFNFLIHLFIYESMDLIHLYIYKCIISKFNTCFICLFMNIWILFLTFWIICLFLNVSILNFNTCFMFIWESMDFDFHTLIPLLICKFMNLNINILIHLFIKESMILKF